MEPLKSTKKPHKNSSPVTYLAWGASKSKDFKYSRTELLNCAEKPPSCCTEKLSRPSRGNCMARSLWFGNHCNARELINVFSRSLSRGARFSKTLLATSSSKAICSQTSCLPCSWCRHRFWYVFQKSEGHRSKTLPAAPSALRLPASHHSRRVLGAATKSSCEQTLWALHWAKSNCLRVSLTLPQRSGYFQCFGIYACVRRKDNPWTTKELSACMQMQRRHWSAQHQAARAAHNSAASMVWIKPGTMPSAMMELSSFMLTTAHAVKRRTSLSGLMQVPSVNTW